MLLLLLTLVLIIALLYFEYRSQDCINGKQCTSGFGELAQGDSSLPPEVWIDRIIRMVRINTHYVTWRLSLVVALLLVFPIAGLILGRLPNFEEWIIIVSLVFMGVYFSSSWLWTHWVMPNSRQMEHSLILLKESLSTPTLERGLQ